MLATLLPAEVFALALVFVRLGSAMMILAGFGEQFVSARARLVMALAVTFVLAPVVADKLPPMPSSAVMLFVLIIGEIVIGVFLGTITRLMLAALATAGMIIAFMSALANALTNDPSAAQQGSIAGTFLTLVGLVFIFVLDLHHQMLAALVNSYEIFVPGQALPVEDFANVISFMVSKVFLLAFQIGAPFVAASVIFQIGMGLLSRLMPQVQIFFIAMPVQIMAGLLILSISLPIAIGWFMTAFQDTLRPYAFSG